MNISIECGVCKEKYDLNEHAAVTPSQYGHTLCKYCVETILKSDIKCCPKCRKPFPSSSELPNYLANQEMEKIVAYNSKYELCQTHDKPLNLYCETDGREICYDCQFTNDEPGHKDHHIDRLEELLPVNIEQREIYQIGRQKINNVGDWMNKPIEKRAYEHPSNLEDLDKIIKLRIIEASLRTQNIIRAEEVNFTEQFDIGSHIYTKRSNQVMGSLAMPQFANTQSGSAIIFPHSLTKCKVFCRYMRLEVKEGLIDIIFPESLLEKPQHEIVPIEIDLDLDTWKKDVKGIKVTFEHFWIDNGYLDDLKVLEFLFLIFQEQIRSVSLTYKQIKSKQLYFDFQIRFEHHLATFSRLVFSSPEILRSVELNFVQSDGADCYMKALIDAFFPLGISPLKSLKIQCDETDLTDYTLFYFFEYVETNNVFGDLSEFYLVLNNKKHYFYRKNNSLWMLDSVKSFVFKANCYCHSDLKRILLESLEDMKQLETYEVELDRPFEEDGENGDEENEEGRPLSVVNEILKLLMECEKIVSIKITMPNETANLDIKPENFASPFIQYVKVNNNILIDKKGTV